MVDNQQEKITPVQRRIREIIGMLDIDVKAFESQSGLSNGFVSKIGNSIRESSFDKILKAFPAINKSWVLTGDGDMFSSARNNANPVGQSYDMDEVYSASRFVDLKDGTYLMITPLVQEYAYAGYLAGFKDSEYIEELPKFPIVVSKHHRGNYQSFEVLGDSMTTTDPDHVRESIYDGSIVTGREIQREHWRYKLHTHRFKDYVIVHKSAGILVKRIINHDVDNGIITIHSLNPDKDMYPDEQLNLDDILQIFNVVKVSQDR